MNRLIAPLLAALLLPAAPAAAQEIDLSGQVRPRFEIRDPVLGPLGEETTREFTSMRSRLSVAAALTDRLSAFIQIQDVRVWGSEGSTTDPSADALDMHQAWLELGDPASSRLALRLGRQELVYGGQRIIGALDWAQQARAFDGGRLRFRPSSALVVDGLAMRIGDEDGGRPDEGLYGLYGSFAAAGGVDGYVLYHSQDAFVGPGVGASEDLSKRYTLGTRWTSAAAGFDWRIEAAYQLGETLQLVPGPGDPEVDDISAYLIAVRVGTRVGERLGVSVWYDRLSGDDDPADALDGVFDTPFATNHKFYGYMDLFLDIPAHTARRGLQDIVLKASYDLAEGQSLGLDIHSFRLSAADGLDSGHIGEEVDLTYAWRYAPGVALTGGLSYFMAGDAAPLPRAAAVEADEGMVWGYAMMSVSF